MSSFVHPSRVSHIPQEHSTDRGSRVRDEDRTFHRRSRSRTPPARRDNRERNARDDEGGDRGRDRRASPSYGDYRRTSPPHPPPVAEETNMYPARGSGPARGGYSGGGDYVGRGGAGGHRGGGSGGGGGGSAGTDWLQGYVCILWLWSVTHSHRPFVLPQSPTSS